MWFFLLMGSHMGTLPKSQMMCPVFLGNCVQEWSSRQNSILRNIKIISPQQENVFNVWYQKLPGVRKVKKWPRNASQWKRTDNYDCILYIQTTEESVSRLWDVEDGKSLDFESYWRFKNQEGNRAHGDKSRLDTAEEDVLTLKTRQAFQYGIQKWPPRSHCVGYPLIASASNSPSGLLYAGEAIACQSPWKESYDRPRLY